MLFLTPNWPCLGTFKRKQNTERQYISVSDMLDFTYQTYDKWRHRHGVKWPRHVEQFLHAKYNRNVYLPKPFRDIFKKSLSYFAPHTWNQFPTELKHSKSLAHFKCMYNKCFNE